MYDEIFDKNIYTLSYVNTNEETVYYDKVFDSSIELMLFVQADEHQDYTSYQIIVTRK